RDHISDVTCCIFLSPLFICLTFNIYIDIFFFFSSRRRHTRSKRDWSSDVCSSDLRMAVAIRCSFTDPILRFLCGTVVPGTLCQCLCTRNQCNTLCSEPHWRYSPHLEEAPVESTRLDRRRISTASLVFIIIAASAPLTVLAGGIPTNYAVAGLLGVPQTYIVLGLLLVLFAVGYTAMSRQIQNAGAFYAYVTEGLGNRQGIAAAILALVSYNMMQIGLYGLFGFAASNLIMDFTGIDLPWWLTALAGWLIVA